MPLALGWLQALALAGVLLLVGGALDGILAGEVPNASSVILMGALVVATAAAAAVSTVTVQRSKNSTERALRRLLVGQLFAVGPLALGRERTGSLVSTATASIDRASAYRAGFLGPIIASLTTPLLVLAVIAVAIDPLTAGLLLLLVPLIPLIIIGVQRAFRSSTGAYRRSAGQLSAAFLSAIQGLTTLTLNRAAARTGEDLRERGEQNRRRVMRLLAGNQVLILAVDAVFSLAMITGAAGLAVWRLGDGAITPGQAAALVLLSTLLTGPVDIVGQFFYIGMTGRNAERELSAAVAARPVSDSAAPAPAGSGGVAALELRGVTAGYERGQAVLSEYSLRIEPGERVVITGPSGSGKSTLLTLAQGLLAPREGIVLVGGEPAGSSPARAALAVVEQTTFLFTGTVADNLRVAKPDASDDELWAALAAAELSEDLERSPDGLATQVGESGLSISGGQAQRVAIARAFLRDASVLLLDEPTAQVDLRSERLITRALAKLAEGRTVVMVSHRPTSILAADRVVTLEATATATASSHSAAADGSPSGPPQHPGHPHGRGARR
ncbi:ABC transporter ATP-binding protein [Pseudoclavibacter sp. RFBJ3]|uniref:ATP-binding cassette domain-containing protein n=1 Tax=unclassified Pseudoclavibacter TaxID=2615177 RepID=UPI000CE73D92|nr:MULTISPECIES: ABC transporter ATP-binding protein [unclassified Pseudoclavibacter]PPF83931.1 ABC transporter ATP-binding protein [Pseudoclavibacter sp. RFBJ5]PPF92211.1 ABC transporter ATP-binding protein [Pseudoclavibacter sp. RFBJ3]PPF97074.1 ABC transporter ATP-binding protein [Pseudoclavibacter sp. RFBH5]PPG23761.1 ABC transporter ATP-binding protein [Pseudoclavibacter sp. RFBI4]